MDHPANFVPVMSIALFAGAYLGGRYALGLPLLIMLISDLFIGFYERPLMLLVYASLALVGLMGLLIKKEKSLETILAGSLAAAIIFFLVTNFAVWQFSPWYERGLAGLWQCYLMGLPFFKNTIMGNLFYSGVFFGAYELVFRWNIIRHDIRKVFKVQGEIN